MINICFKDEYAKAVNASDANAVAALGILAWPIIDLLRR